MNPRQNVKVRMSTAQKHFGILCEKMNIKNVENSRYHTDALLPGILHGRGEWLRVPQAGGRFLGMPMACKVMVLEHHR